MPISASVMCMPMSGMFPATNLMESYQAKTLTMII